MLSTLFKGFISLDRRTADSWVEPKTNKQQKPSHWIRNPLTVDTWRILPKKKIWFAGFLTKTISNGFHSQINEALLYYVSFSGVVHCMGTMSQTGPGGISEAS